MPNFTAVFARTETGWVADEADLDEVEIIDDIADLLRECVVEASAESALLLVEEDDEWFAVVRVDGEGEPRVFLSDPRAALTSRLAALLYDDLAADAEQGPGTEPAGDANLLQDLGTGADELLGLSDRAVPGDALQTVAEHAGFGEELDQLR